MRGVKYILIPAGILVLIAVAGAFDLFEKESDDYNVLIIVIDTLRADHLSTYGYFRETSPNIDEFAAESIKFNNHFCQIPFTPPSHWSIFTGLYPHTHNIAAYNWNQNPNHNWTNFTRPQINRSDWNRTIRPPVNWSQFNRTNVSTLVRNNTVMLEQIINRTKGFPILPFILKDEGYKTAAFVSSGMVGTLEAVFEEWTFNEERSGTGFRKTTDDAIAWLEENKDEKFFLWVHYWDVHQPYQPIPEYDIFEDEKKDKYSSARYDGEIRYVDHKIGQLLDKIDELGLKENTIVIITGDHGEMFGEYNCRDFTGKNTPCTGHYVSLYNPETYVPLIIRVPGVEAKQINSITQSVDLAPTIVELLDAEVDDVNTSFEGYSLLPLINDEERQYEFAFSELRKGGSYSKSLMVPGWKLMLIENNGGKIVRLYDMEKGEDEDFSQSEQEIASELIIEMDNLMKGKELENAEPDEETKKMLRSLGYVS